MSSIKAYDVKARKNVSMINPQPYQMKNGTWALKGTSSETGISLFRIVGKNKPETTRSKLDMFKKFFTGRNCECGKGC
ncbi:MAG: hypothetical protein OXC46_05970 [Thaumarchaeota archaeon]|nr:hypothetical protein [Nitrososphaerota archaeon]